MATFLEEVNITFSYSALVLESHSLALLAFIQGLVEHVLSCFGSLYWMERIIHQNQILIKANSKLGTIFMSNQKRREKCERGVLSRTQGTSRQSYVDGHF